MGRVAKGLRQRVGHRGSALLFFAVLDLVYCCSLLFPSPRERNLPALRFLAGFVGIIASWPEPPHGWKERTWTHPTS